MVNFQTVPYDASLVAMLDILALLNKLNHKVDGLKVPYDTFHMNDLGEVLDVRIDYIQWLTDESVRDIKQKKIVISISIRRICSNDIFISVDLIE